VRLLRLTLVDVRNYADLTLEPPRGLCLFAGSNGQGKSNLLEAIGLLATGKSFRTSHERDLIREGSSRAVAAGEVTVAAGSVRLSCTIAAGAAGTRKTYAVNSKPVRYASYLGNARTVTFVPADMEIVSGAPARRRTVLNAALAQTSAAYFAALAAYGSYLVQKSAMLRGAIAFDATLLDAYDERLAAEGAMLVGARAEYVAALESEAQEAYARIAGDADGRLRVRYVPNAGADELARRLREARGGELARKRALVGPHRDDVELTLDGRPLHAFGSQGQQRSAVLALKIAEYAVMTQRTGETPLLLLDDVLSELDPARQRAFLAAVGGVDQAFLTATVAPQDAPAAATFTVEAATVRRAA